jgi:hypothetical protein
MVGRGQELSIDVTNASDFNQHSKTTVGKKKEKPFILQKGVLYRMGHLITYLYVV